jgi:peroxin-3
MSWLENKQLIHWLLVLAVAITSFSPLIHRTFDASVSFMIASFMLLSIRLQAHFENVQRISNTSMLPFATHYLRLWISHLTGSLLQGKGGYSSALTPKDKVDTWERIKILSMIDTRLISLMIGEYFHGTLH